MFDECFAESVELLLLGYGYNTARAYRADLEDIYLWTTERGFDPLALTSGHLTQYQALLRRRQYSESTIRRRRTALRRLLNARSQTPHNETVEKSPRGAPYHGSI